MVKTIDKKTNKEIENPELQVQVQHFYFERIIQEIGEF